MTASRWALGTTNRSAGDAGRVQHAATRHKRSLYGATYRALCGAGVYHHAGESFDPEHPRACRACVRQVERTPISGKA